MPDLGRAKDAKEPKVERYGDGLNHCELYALRDAAHASPPPTGAYLLGRM